MKTHKFKFLIWAVTISCLIAWSGVAEREEAVEAVAAEVVAVAAEVEDVEAEVVDGLPWGMLEAAAAGRRAACNTHRVPSPDPKLRDRTPAGLPWVMPPDRMSLHVPTQVRVLAAADLVHRAVVGRMSLDPEGLAVALRIGLPSVLQAMSIRLAGPHFRVAVAALRVAIDLAVVAPESGQA